MFQPDDPSAVPAMPTPAAAGTPGWFSPGDPSTGDQPTLLSADFMNIVLAELLAILAAAGIAPSKTQTNQLLLAIQAIVRQVGDARYLTASANFVTPTQLAAAIANLIGNPSAPLQTLLAIDQQLANDEGAAAALTSLVNSKAAITDVQAWIATALASADAFATAGDAATLSAAEAFATSAANGAEAAAVAAAEAFATTAANNAEAAAISAAEAFATSAANGAESAAISAAEAFATSAANGAEAAAIAAAEAYANGQATAAEAAAIAAAGGYTLLADISPDGTQRSYGGFWAPGAYSDIVIISNGIWIQPASGQSVQSQLCFFYDYYNGDTSTDYGYVALQTGGYQLLTITTHCANETLYGRVFGGSTQSISSYHNAYAPGYRGPGGAVTPTGPISGWAMDIDTTVNVGAKIAAHGRILVYGRRAS